MKANKLYWILLIVHLVSSQATHSDIGVHNEKLERLSHGDDSNIENEGGRTYTRVFTLGEHRIDINQKGRFQGVQDPEEESM